MEDRILNSIDAALMQQKQDMLMQQHGRTLRIDAETLRAQVYPYSGSPWTIFVGDDENKNLLLLEDI